MSFRGHTQDAPKTVGAVETAGPTQSYSSNLSNMVSRICCASMFAASLIVAGCGGGGGAGPDTSTTLPPTPAGETGEVLITLTDAPGDFASYIVGVDSLTLTRANGDIVETLPISTTVDFAELTEVTEFLTAATVPVGAYTHVSMTLDYSDAQIWVEDASGVDVQATVEDAAGDPIETITMDVTFPNTDVVVIRPGIPAAVSIDFDLAMSNTVDLDMDPPVVTVQPFLVALPELETDRAHRLRGALKSVDESESTVTLKVRPFRTRNRDYGEVTFASDDETIWAIDGENFTGAQGITAMAALAENTPVVAGVTVDDQRVLTAHTVLAGSSVPWTGHDVVHGVVKSREGDALTVNGARIEYADGTEVFRGDFTVLLGENTTVTSILIDAATTESISVGQRITAFGELTDDASIDATEGRVRMRVSNLTGVAQDADSLVVELLGLSGRGIDIYDFSGTGETEADDADPANYEIDTGLLMLETIEPGDLVRVRGNVNEWMQAPADFNAVTVVDVDLTSNPAHFHAFWHEIGGTAVPFESIAPDRLDVDLEQARHHLRVAGIPSSYFGELDSLAIVPRDRRAVWGVLERGEGGELHLFRDFGELVEEIEAQLDDGNLMVSIIAGGSYNGESGVLTSGRAIFVFQSQAI